MASEMAWRALVVAMAIMRVSGAGGDVEERRLSGGCTAVAGTCGTSGSDLSHLDAPMGIDVDAAGNLFVADQNNHRILKFAPASTPGTDGVVIAGGRGNSPGLDKTRGPYDVTVDAVNGGVVVVEFPGSGDDRVTHWPTDVTGILLLDSITSPIAAAIGPSQEVYVSLNHQNKVVKVAGGLSSDFATVTSVLGVAVDAAGNVYASDHTQFQVLKWAPNSASPSVAAGGALNQVKANRIAVDAAGRLFLAETDNARIAMWEAGASAGTMITTATWPIGVALDHESVYYSDRSLHCVMKCPLPTTTSTTTTTSQTFGCSQTEIFTPFLNRFLFTYTRLGPQMFSFEEARRLCLELCDECGGITCVGSPLECDLRATQTLGGSGYETSYVKGVTSTTTPDCNRDVVFDAYPNSFLSTWTAWGPQTFNFSRAQQLCVQECDCGGTVCDENLVECTLRATSIPQASSDEVCYVKVARTTQTASSTTTLSTTSSISSTKTTSTSSMSTSTPASTTGATTEIMTSTVPVSASISSSLADSSSSTTEIMTSTVAVSSSPSSTEIASSGSHVESTISASIADTSTSDSGTVSLSSSRAFTGSMALASTSRFTQEDTSRTSVGESSMGDSNSVRILSTSTPPEQASPTTMRVTTPSGGADTSRRDATPSAGEQTSIWGSVEKGVGADSGNLGASTTPPEGHADGVIKGTSLPEGSMHDLAMSQMSSSAASGTAWEGTTSTPAQPKANTDPPSPAQLATKLGGVLEGAAEELLAALNSSSADGTVRYSLEEGEAVAKRLSGSSPGQGLSLSMPGTDVLPVSATLPASVLTALQSLDPSGAGLAVVMATLSPEVAKGLGGKASSGTGTVVTEVLGLVSFELHSLKGGQLGVQGLSEPIRLAMPVNSSAGATCAFFDEVAGAWSTKGVSTDLAGDQVNCLTVHLSLFGVIFQGILDTVLCSQLLTLFNSEAFSNLAKGDWPSSKGAIAVWLLLGLLVLVMAAAAVVDRTHSWGEHFFLVELPPKQATPEVQSDEVGVRDSQNSKRAAPPPRWPVIAATCLWCASACQFFKQGSALRDVVDELVGSWFEYFSDVREVCEEICSQAFGTMHGTGSAREMALVTNVRVTSHLFRVSLRRLVAASLGVSDALVTFVMHDEGLHEFLTDEHAQRLRMTQAERARPRSSLARLTDMMAAQRLHRAQELAVQPAASEGQGRAATAASEGQSRANTQSSVKEGATSGAFGPLRSLQGLKKAKGAVEHLFVPKASVGVLNRGIQWKTTRNKREAWVILHHEVSERLNHTSALFMRRSGLGRMILRIFAVQNPLTSVLYFDPLMSSKMRALFVALDLLGTVMLTALFFQTSGGVKSKKSARCEGDEVGDALLYMVGRIIVIAAASVLLADLPVHALGSLHTRSFKMLDANTKAWRRQLRVWTIQDGLVWFLGLCYAAFCILFVLLFMANISEDDHDEMAVGLIVIWSEVFIVFPLVISAAVPTLSWLALHGSHAAGFFDREQVMRNAHEETTSTTMLPIVYM